jgi:predicted MFS family arabinose efflux permease
MSPTDDVEVAEAPPSQPAVAPPPLWRNKAYNLLWSGQALSELGTSMSTLAFPLLVLAITGSPVRAGVVGTVGGLVRAACRLPMGVLVDRVDRRRAMLAADGVRLLAFAALGLMIAFDQVTMWMIIGTAAIEAVGGTVFSNAEMAAIRNIVPMTQLPAASARNEARNYGASLVGPPLGGLLYSLARAVPFLADAISYACSLTGIALIRRPLQEKRREAPGSARSELAEGITFVLREPFLRAVLLIAAPINMGVNGMIFAIVILLRQHGTAPAVIGSVETIIGVGGLLGALCAPVLQRLLSLRVLATAICWAGTVLIAVSAPLTGSLLVAVPITLAIFLGPAANAGLFGYFAAITPDRLQGRATSVVLLGAMSLSGVAPIVAGLSIEHFGGTGTVLAFAGVMGVAALVATFSKGIRSMRPISALQPISG